MRLSWVIPFQKRATRKAWYAVTMGLVFLCGLKDLRAQSAKTWLWGNSGGGATVSSRCSKPAVDQSGNSYIAGSFRSYSEALTFSNSTMALTDFNPGVFTIFLAKYDRDGNLLWAKSFKSGDADGGLIGADASGNIYCTGSYRDSICFGNITINGNGSQYTQFLAKFTTTGNLLWAKNMTSPAPGHYLDYNALEIDADNNILMAGSFDQANLLLDGISLSNSDASAASYDYFVARFNPDGNTIWAATGGSADKDDFGTSLCTGVQGALYVGTMYQDTGVILNGGQIRVYKYNHTGAVAWNEQINAGSGVLLGALTSDVKGDLYLTGAYAGILTLDNITLDEENGGCFVAKYSQMGEAVWARSSKSNAEDISVFTTGIGVDQTGMVSISGSYVYSLLTPVTTVTFDTVTLTLQGNRDAFMVQYNSEAKVTKAVAIGGIYSDFGSGLNVRHDGTIYYAGSFYSPAVTLDDVVLNNTPDPTGSYYGKFYIAKFGTKAGTGIDRITDPAWLKVYPNPAQDYVTIDGSVPVQAVKITDGLGRLVCYEVMPANTMHKKLNTSQYAKGLYYVYVYSTDGYAVKTLTLN